MPTNIEPHVSIIILNWNGWKDTIECLESVLKLDYPNFHVILIDNNSADDSADKISCWAEGKRQEPIETSYPEVINPLEKKPLAFVVADLSEYGQIEIAKQNAKLLFFKSNSNLGFAVACNRGMKIATNYYQSDYFFLLNNDTVIKKDVLANLITILENDKSIGAAQATIYNYFNPGQIDNAGGRILFWGQTKYYRKIDPTEVREISFINGCALCVRTDITTKLGPLSEKYFFGEEDFEFSYRLNKLSIKMVCAGNSQVFHKVGISAQVLLKNVERKIFLFAVNRIVDLRDFYPYLLWIVWKYFALIYFGYLLHKNKIPFKRTCHVLQVINHNVTIYQIMFRTIRFEELLRKL